MTDTLPSWAMEKALEIVGPSQRWIGPHEVHAMVVQAIRFAYQQGKQEMKEKAAKCVEESGDRCQFLDEIADEIRALND